MPDNRLLIAGTGAMACLFGARLAAAGVHVTLFGTWAEGVAALAQSGVRLIESDGSEFAFPVEAFRAAVDEPLPRVGAKHALVLVKAWQTRRVAAQLQRLLAPDGVALTLQNGLGNRETLAETLGHRRAAAGAVTLGATLAAPGVVRAAGAGTVSLGPEPALEPLRAMLQRAGFNVAAVPRVDSLLWGKVIVNVGINPLTALLRVPNGALLTRPDALSVLREAVTEAATVAAAAGIPLPYNDPVAVTESVAHKTAANRSSMLQDVQRGAPTEIDAICGAVARAGAAANVPTPVVTTLWRLVAALTKESP